MLRRSFRNWFQPHYPYIYSGFRCVEELEHASGERMLTKPFRAILAVRISRAEVRAGLTQPGQKELPSKYLYDEVGSALFEVISVLPEYGLMPRR